METTEVTARDKAAVAIISGQGFDASEIDAASYDECLIEADGQEFLILTDDEADERTADYIRDSLWAFNASFLASYMPEGIDAEEIDAIRGDRCEDANEAMVALVEAGPRSFEDLVADAILSDGRGHFLAGYDGEEIEHQDEGGTYWYGYRQ